MSEERIHNREPFSGRVVDLSERIPLRRADERLSDDEMAERVRIMAERARLGQCIWTGKALNAVSLRETEEQVA